MKIGEREISAAFPPYIVAEISCNHVGRLDYALKLIEEAKKAGADAVKFQCYRADTITLNSDKPDFIIKDGPWKGRKLYELYKKCETPRKWFPELFRHAHHIGIPMFCSVFSHKDVDFLELFDPPCYKIASMEITDIPLIEYAAKTGKLLIVSTGMANHDELIAVMRTIREKTKTPPLEMINALFLHCVSGYPTALEEAALYKISDIYGWGKPFGISDHTIGREVPIAATALGACLIEKHLMLGLSLPEYLPEDFDFSLRPEEFNRMCHSVKGVWQAMQPSERKGEESSRQLRRSLYVVRSIRAGDRFTTENVRSIRPAYGMAPKDLPYVLKSRARQDIKAGTALKEEHLIGA